MGTFDDVIILVSILSQSKNAVRKGNIDRNYAAFYQAMENAHTCDFLALVNLYKASENSRNRHQLELKLETFWEVKDMIWDIKKRMKKKEAFKELMEKMQAEKMQAEKKGEKEGERNW